MNRAGAIAAASALLPADLALYHFPMGKGFMTAANAWGVNCAYRSAHRVRFPFMSIRLNQSPWISMLFVPRFPFPPEMPHNDDVVYMPGNRYFYYRLYELTLVDFFHTFRPSRVKRKDISVT
jgi:hypothetical protein